MGNIAYFTLKDRNSKPRATVCLMEHDEIVTYGISVKSKSDKWKEGKGRKMARDRATAAMYLGDSYFSESNYLSRKEVYKNIHDLCFGDYMKLTKILNVGRAIYTCKGDIVDEMSFNNLVRYFMGDR